MEGGGGGKGRGMEGGREGGKEENDENQLFHMKISQQWNMP